MTAFHAEHSCVSAVRIRVLAAAAALTLLAGCSQLEPVAPSQPITDPTQLYMRLALNYAAVNLTSDTTVPAANTLQLVATPYDGNGAAMTGLPAPTFKLLGGDTTALKVTADGRLQGLEAANQLQVLAELTVGEVRHSDTVVVNVQDITAANVPMLDTLSIHVPSDSAVWYVTLKTGNNLTSILASYSGLLPSPTLSPRAVDTHGNAMFGLAIDYASLDSGVAVVDRRTGVVTPIAAGHVRIVARTIAYGVARADTMIYAVNPSFTADFAVDAKGFVYNNKLRPNVPSLTIVAGGIVGWYSFTAQPMDVTFDNPADVAAPPTAFCDFLSLAIGPGPYCDTGNIAVWAGDSLNLLAGMRFRQFPVPGTYPYHSTTTGAAGQVVVMDRIAPLP